ncbi:MAG TPA: glycosyl hydrolase [Gemmatimonadaceae bacterium]|nr:glycosyl hydrolase [Gemmatimonadaceae bacterium]
MNGCLGKTLGRAIGRKESPPSPPVIVTRESFGLMVDGGFLQYPSGTPRPGVTIDIPFGLIRTWDTGAVPYQIARGNWDGFDGILNFAAERQLEVMYCFGWHKDLTPWELCVPGTQVPQILPWVALVNHILDRAAGRIKYWELWNEPAVGSLYWQGGTVQHLFQLAEHAARIIKARHPQSVLLTPAFNAIREEYGRVFLDQYLALMAKHGSSADRLAFHSYDGTPEGTMESVRIIRALMGRHKVTLPLHCTEIALVGTTEAETAKNMERVFTLLAQEGIPWVWDAHIPGAECYSATEGLGRTWKATFDRLSP